MRIKGIGLLIKVLLTVLAVLFLFYGYALYLNIDSWQRADKELLTTVNNNLVHYLSNLDNEVLRVNLAQEQFKDKMEINLLALDNENIFTDYSRLEMIKSVQAYLSQFFYSYNILKNTQIFIRDMERTIDCFGGMREMNQEEYSFFADYYRNNGKKVCYYKGSLQIIQPYPVNGLVDTDPLYIVGSEIDIDTLTKQINNLSKENIYKMVLIADDNSWFAGDAELFYGFGEILREDESEVIKSDEDGKNYCVVRVQSEVFHATLYAVFPEDILKTNNSTGNILFLFFSIGAVVSIILLYYILNHILGKPMKRLMEAFTIIKNGDVNYQIQHTREDEFAYLYNNFNEMIHHINRLNQEVARQEKLVVEAELRQLQYQINPHFLYNSLYMVYRLAKKGNTQMIEELSQYLGGYYRYITKNISKFVPIRDEIEHCKKYTGIQQMRFMNRISIVFEELDPKYNEMLIPILILQPLIENAFEHGVQMMQSGGMIHIYFESRGPEVIFIVEDNGDSLKGDKIQELYKTFQAEGEESVSGLVNVYKRVKGYFGEKGDLILEKTENCITKVSLKLYDKEYRDEQK